MQKLKILLFLFVLLLSLRPMEAQEQDIQYIEERVEKYIGWMDQKDEAEVWKAALRLEALGNKAIPFIKVAIPKASEIAQIGCLKALLVLGEKDYSLFFLMDILEHGTNAKAKGFAADLVILYGDYELEDRLLKIMDNTTEPNAKITICKVLWQVAKNPQAKKRLKEYLGSSNEEVKFAAALALGEMGDVAAVKLILNALKHEPSLRGRLAKALLQQEDIVKRYENLLSRAPQPTPIPKVEASKKNQYDFIEEIVHKIKEYHVQGDKFDEKKLLDAAAKGLAEATDIHSAFWTEKEWDAFVRESVNEEYVGIGLYANKQNALFVVIAPLYGGPAYKAGIRSKDQIVAIDGVETLGKSMEEIQQQIKGEKGTKVTLKVYRNGWPNPKEMEIIRDTIKVPSLFYEMLPGSIGYIRLTQFGKKATDDMTAAMQEMESKGMKALILDLRDNAGGWLETAVDLVDKFLEPGKLIVYSEGRHPKDGQRREFFSIQTATPKPSYPLVVLVNSSSASASEVVAGSLQCYKRATIVGQRTYGKGSVQRPIPLETRPNARLKLTIAMYYLPDGRCIHNEMDSEGRILKQNGVVPSIEMRDESMGSAFLNEERQKLEEKNAFDAYLDKHYPQHRESFEKLAENDDLSTKLYPDFDDWYASLETRASAQEVRKWLRETLRERVADERGIAFACNYQEDNILQRGIIQICEDLKISVSDIAEYKLFAEKFKKK